MAGKTKTNIADKSAADLKSDELRLRKEIFDLKFKHATRSLTDTMAVRRAKKELARVLTAATSKQSS